VDLTQDVSGVLPGANGGSPFDQGNGAIFERINTEDFLLGDIATATAKFAVTNVAGGTPTLSVANSNLTATAFLTGTGNLGTTNSQNLVLGGSTTGSILLNTSGANNVGIGFNGTPLSTLDVRGTLGTSSFASISGQSSFAGLVVDNSQGPI